MNLKKTISLFALICIASPLLGGKGKRPKLKADPREKNTHIINSLERDLSHKKSLNKCYNALKKITTLEEDDATKLVGLLVKHYKLRQKNFNEMYQILEKKGANTQAVITINGLTQKIASFVTGN